MKTQRISLSNLKPDVKNNLLNGKLLITAALGASGAFLLNASTDIDNIEVPYPEEEPLIADEGIVEFQADSIFGKADDSLSFGQAFRSQRDELGPGGIFEYKNKYYNTYFKEEWDVMSEQDKKEYFASVDQYIDYNKVTYTSNEGVSQDLNIDVETDPVTGNTVIRSEGTGESNSFQDIYDDANFLDDDSGFFISSSDVEIMDNKGSEEFTNDDLGFFDDDLVDPSFVEIEEDHDISQDALGQNHFAIPRFTGFDDDVLESFSEITDLELNTNDWNLNNDELELDF